MTSAVRSDPSKVQPAASVEPPRAGVAWQDPQYRVEKAEPGQFPFSGLEEGLPPVNPGRFTQVHARTLARRCVRPDLPRCYASDPHRPCAGLS
jgi:hypothetical protein